MDATTAAALLPELLATVARTEFDASCWEVLRARARASTQVLAAAGLVPGHLVVDRRDPPVVVARTLAAAARHLPAADTERMPTRRIEVA